MKIQFKFLIQWILHLNIQLQECKEGKQNKISNNFSWIKNFGTKIKILKFYLSCKHLIMIYLMLAWLNCKEAIAIKNFQVNQFVGLNAHSLIAQHKNNIKENSKKQKQMKRQRKKPKNMKRNKRKKMKKNKLVNFVSTMMLN